VIATLPATARTYADTTVAPNTNYSYKVSAVDAANNTSTATSATPDPVRTPIATDSQAPTVPTNIRTLAVTTSSATIAWNASTDNVAVAGYHVYRGTTYLGDATGLSYTNSGLTANTTYVYTVKAFDAAGNNSAATSALSVMTLKVTGNLIGDLNSDASVDLFDLSIMMSHWHDVNVPAKFGDINQDGKVDVFDLSTLLTRLGEKA